MTNKPNLYIIDGTNFIFRAYYAIQHLTNSKGFPTNAIYGFTNMLLKLLRDERPEHVVVVFDTGKPSFRNELFAEYKANRQTPPDDLMVQFEHIPKMVEGLNIPVLQHVGVEADDVIGTLATRVVKAGGRAVIVTGDKDFMQLVDDDHIVLLDTMKGVRSGPKQVKEKFGVTADKVVDVLALAGDASDNIPGIRGIGPKTASKLINEFGSLDNLLENADKVKGAVGAKVKEGAKNALLSRELARIKTDVPVDCDITNFIRRPYDVALLSSLFREFEFSALLADLEKNNPTPASNNMPLSEEPNRDYRAIRSEEALSAYLATIPHDTWLSIDTETTSLDPLQADLVGISLSWRDNEAVYIPVGHRSPGLDGQLSVDEALTLLKPILRDPRIPKIGQNIKYDYKVLATHGIEITPIVCDTMVASYLLNPSASHNLDDMSAQYLNRTTIRFSEVVGKGKDRTFADVDIVDAVPYACQDADNARQIATQLMKQLEENKAMVHLFHTVEMPLVSVLANMERRGVKIDTERLGNMSAQFESELATIEATIYADAGVEFNIQSPKQLGEVLFEQMKLPGGKKTKTGYSTAADVLEKLASHHTIAKHILDYRMMAKLKSTYIDALPQMVNRRTGRVHTDFMQTITETGRLSSREPNLQNIPIRSDAGKKIREAFIADRHHMLISADYSQIELRLLAHMTEDETLISAFKHGVDIHALTAARLFGVDASAVTDNQRAVGKTVNFSVIYGQTPFGLSQQLGISNAQAKQYIDHYFDQYPTVLAYREKVLAQASHDGFVETLFGRRRYLPDINSKNLYVRQLAERMGFNAIFQGTAADIMKMAMIELEKQLLADDSSTRLLIQVHDELIVECPDAAVASCADRVRHVMESVASLRVPLDVNVSHGRTWAECS